MAAIPTGTTGKYDSIHPADRRLVGLNGFGDMLGISRSMAHNLVQRGEVETVRVGRRLLVTVESIDAYIARLRSEQGVIAPTRSGAPKGATPSSRPVEGNPGSD